PAVHNRHPDRHPDRQPDDLRRSIRLRLLGFRPSHHGGTPGAGNRLRTLGARTGDALAAPGCRRSRPARTPQTHGPPREDRIIRPIKMRSRRTVPFTLAVAVAATSILSISLDAFGGSGHRIVGTLAEMHLKGTRALKEVRKILRPNETLAEAAVWPDTIKDPL